MARETYRCFGSLAPHRLALSRIQNTNARSGSSTTYVGYIYTHMPFLFSPSLSLSLLREVQSAALQSGPVGCGKHLSW